MNILKKFLLFLPITFLALIAAFDLWGFLTLGTITPQPQPIRDQDANAVVMVFGATGSAGDGLLKAAMEDPDVKQVYVVTRRTSPRIDAGVATGKLTMMLHKDFTDYREMNDILAQVNTVLWGLGTSSLQVDEETYTWIHVDFPLAFVKQWLQARSDGPMSFHYIAGMGTDGDAQWALDKSRTEREVANMAATSDLRSFSYRSAYIRPTSEQANVIHYLGEALLRPGYLVIAGRDLGAAMLEISARTQELPNGTLIDNLDSIRYAKAYREYNQ